jgi:hypothetical protein
MTVLAEIQYDESQYNSVKEVDPPRPLFVADRLDIPGKPTTPDISRGHKDGTVIAFSNYNVVAIDDPKQTVPYYINNQHTAVRNQVRTRRDVRENKMKTEAESGVITTQISEAVKWITAKLKLINRMMKTIDNFFKMIAKVVMKLNQIIAWIKALPVALVLLMAKILVKLIGAAKAAASAAFSKLGGAKGSGPGTEFGALLKETKTTLMGAASVAKSALLLGTSVALLATTFSGTGPTSKKRSKKIF